jgi:small subunit ribosomal protein S17
MTESEENVNEEQTPDAEAPEADAVAEQAETAPDEDAAQAAAEESRAEEAAEEAPAPEAAEEAPAEPQERVHPKQQRKQERSRHTGNARPPRSPDERAQERLERRQRKARHRRAYRQKMRERRGGEPRAEAPPPEPKASGKLKVRQGVVVSDRADKTITVRIDVARQHRMYKKIVRTSTTLHAHDEQNEAGVGDTVRVIESRPLSRTKRWRLVEILERAR